MKTDWDEIGNFFGGFMLTPWILLGFESDRTKELKVQAVERGCTCSSTISRRKATPEEYKASKLKRLKNRKLELANMLYNVIMELESLEKKDEHLPSNDKKDS